MTTFSFFKYFDAFQLDVNIVNFVYYGKTRIPRHKFKNLKEPVSEELTSICTFMKIQMIMYNTTGKFNFEKNGIESPSHNVFFHL